MYVFVIGKISSLDITDDCKASFSERGQLNAIGRKLIDVTAMAA